MRSTHPFRDSAIVYAVLAALVVLVAWATGAPLLPRNPDNDRFVVGALPVAIGFFAACMGYAWWRFRRGLETEQESQ